ncbi:MAG: hypothetical protein AABX17_02810 [Nanoarchaeota archaeon]
MRIVGFTINKIQAERKNVIRDKLEIKSGLNIEDITKEEVDISKSAAIKFDFTYSIDYAPNLAEIKIKGSVIALDEKEESKDLLKEWKKKKFNSPLKIPLFNFIMDKCTIKSLEIEEQLGLPFHIPLPRLTPTETQNPETRANYTG